MLVRLVQMSFHPEHVPAFLDLFRRTAPRIRGFAGCRHLELLQSGDAQFATLSHWDSADALEAYRASELFQTTWAETKRLFDDRPAATSYRVAWPEGGDT